MDKKQIIEQAARDLAAEQGAINVSKKDVCARANISDGSFSDIMDETFAELMNRLDLPTWATVDRKRVIPELRRKHILDAAIELAKTKGYKSISRDDVANSANIVPGLVSYYFQSIDLLRILVLKTAVKREVLEIVAQGLVQKDPIAIQAPSELKHRAIAYLAEL